MHYYYTLDNGSHYKKLVDLFSLKSKNTDSTFISYQFKDLVVEMEVQQTLFYTSGAFEK